MEPPVEVLELAATAQTAPQDRETSGCGRAPIKLYTPGHSWALDCRFQIPEWSALLQARRSLIKVRGLAQEKRQVSRPTFWSKRTLSTLKVVSFQGLVSLGVAWEAGLALPSRLPAQVACIAKLRRMKELPLQK